MLHTSCSGVHVIRSFVSSLILDRFDDIGSSFRVDVCRTDSSSWPCIVIEVDEKEKKNIYIYISIAIARFYSHVIP